MIVDMKTLETYRKESIRRLVGITSLPAGHIFEFENHDYVLKQSDIDRAFRTIDNLSPKTTAAELRGTQKACGRIY